MLQTEPLSIPDFEDTSPESICAYVAKVFSVRTTEIALLQLSGNLLKFIYPPELQRVGAIPLSGSSVAARTARKKRPELFNSFTRVKHSSVFEVVKLGETESNAEVIQKFMSAPILATDGEVVGVLQVSRKAHSAAAAGPDFTGEDLHKLESVAGSLARIFTQGQP